MDAHEGLADVFDTTGNIYACAIALKQTFMRLPNQNNYKWARIAADLLHKLDHQECVELQPDWWNDDALKGYSAKILAAYPPYDPELPALMCRAEVMAGHCMPPGRVWWKVGPRTPAELREAAEFYRRAAELEKRAGDNYSLELSNAKSCELRAKAAVEKFGEDVPCFTFPLKDNKDGTESDGASAASVETWTRVMNETRFAVDEEVGNVIARLIPDEECYTCE